jgi:predicted 3-demethylubiquinone-9 3-methyltransferase (glyoxalase superfamily)
MVMVQAQKIRTCLWFDNNAEEAVTHYLNIFDDSKIIEVTHRDGEGNGSGKKGPVLAITFQLHGHDLMALNGGPQYELTEAVSLAVTCRTQEEVDLLWEDLSEGGEEGQCGWLKDKFGLSWQIIPAALIEMLRDKNPEKSRRVMEAMLKMRKIDIAELKKAHEG